MLLLPWQTNFSKHSPFIHGVANCVRYFDFDKICNVIVTHFLLQVCYAVAKPHQVWVDVRKTNAEGQSMKITQDTDNIG